MYRLLLDLQGDQCRTDRAIQYKVILVQVFSCSNTGSIRDDHYWTSRENSLELIELSSINKVSLVQVSSCSNTEPIKDDPCWISRKNGLELKIQQPKCYSNEVPISTVQKACQYLDNLNAKILFSLQEFFLLLMRDILDPKYGMFKTIEENHLIWFNKQVSMFL